MNNGVVKNIDNIQGTFMEVQNCMEGKPDLNVLVDYLDAIPPEFRSVGYESAAMELSLLDLAEGNKLQHWNSLYQRAREVHTFHLDIGLGWAFAKLNTLPSLDWSTYHPQMRWMVFDGIGYYFGLFRGRRTVKNQQVPSGIEGVDLGGFDQGLGRRLWYIAKGKVDALDSLIQSFPLARRAGLWRGIGIASAYVGGVKADTYENLVRTSKAYHPQLCMGVALASFSRYASNSITQAISVASAIISQKKSDELFRFMDQMEPHQAESNSEIKEHWIIKLERTLA